MSDDDSGAGTLEDTPGGAYLQDERLYDGMTSELSRAHADAVWASVAQRHARLAEGDVRAFVCDPDPDSVFVKIELPELVTGLRVGSVTSLTVVDVPDDEPPATVWDVSEVPALVEAPAKPGALKRMFGKGAPPDQDWTLLRPQWARHRDGYEVSSVDRVTVGYRADGVRATVTVEAGLAATIVYPLSLRTRLDDGAEPQGAELLARMRAGLAAMGSSSSIHGASPTPPLIGLISAAVDLQGIDVTAGDDHFVLTRAAR